MTNGRRTVSTSLLRTRSHTLRMLDLSEQSSKANKNVEVPTARMLTLTTSLHAERQAVTVTVTTRAGGRPRVLARWAVNPKQAHEASSWILARRRTSALSSALELACLALPPLIPLRRRPSSSSSGRHEETIPDISATATTSIASGK